MVRYIIITPVHNEEKFLRLYIDSIVAQSLKPRILFFIDDSSTDSSARIINEFVEKYDWIKYIYHPSESKKVQGSKVIQAFNFALNKIELSDIDFISKIDADLILPANYFEKISHAFRENNKVGICGGIIQEYYNQKWIDIKESAYHVRGALKSYRIECFQEIGGLLPVLGWDGIDEMKALYLGWETKTINIRVKHLRPASKDYNPIIMNFKNGSANYKNGGNFFLALIRTIVRLFDKPYIISGISYFAGYLFAFITRAKRNVDKDLAKYINHFHLNRLLNFNRYY